MSGGNFLGIFTFGGEQIDFLFRAAVHRVIQFELAHTEIIFSAQFGEYFFNLGGLRIAAGLGEFDDRFLIVERFH